MRNRRAFQQFLEVITQIHGRQLNTIARKAYRSALSDYSDAECFRAFNYILAHTKYFPMPAHIIDAIAITSPKPLTTATEARRQIEDWLYNGAPEPKNPIVQEIIRSYGGWERLGMMIYADLKFCTHFSSIGRSKPNSKFLASTVYKVL